MSESHGPTPGTNIMEFVEPLTETTSNTWIGAATIIVLLLIIIAGWNISLLNRRRGTKRTGVTEASIEGLQIGDLPDFALRKR